MQAERSLAENLMESEVLEILSVLAKATEANKAPVTRAAQRCLDVALEYGLIRNNDGKTSGKSEPWSDGITLHKKLTTSLNSTFAYLIFIYNMWLIKNIYVFRGLLVDAL